MTYGGVPKFTYSVLLENEVAWIKRMKVNIPEHLQYCEVIAMYEMYDKGK